MANDIFGILRLVILSFLSGKIETSKCYYYIDNYQFYSSTSCTNGCCFYNTYNPCCSVPDYNNNNNNYYYYSYYSNTQNYVDDTNLSAGTIAGIVLGSIFGLAVFTAIVICVCNSKRRQTRALRGTVIAQPGTSYVTPAVVSGQSQPYPYGGNVNAGFMMGPTCPPYNMDNLAPPPYYTVVEGGYPNQQFSYLTENRLITQNYNSVAQDAVSAPNNSCSAPQSESNNCCYSECPTESNYYSGISGSFSQSGNASTSADGGRLYQYPHGRNVNGEYKMSCTYPGYNKESDLLPPQYSTVIDGGYPNTQCPHPMDVNSVELL